MPRAIPWVLPTSWVLSLPLPAYGDPPPPKVCVVVAGDPDEAVRSAAETVSDAVAASPSLRGVADPDARAALRGEQGNGAGDLRTARHALHGTPSDGPVLDELARDLGCALVVELASRPEGTMLRLYDVLHHDWPAATEGGSVDRSVADRLIVPAADRVRGARERPASPSPVAAGGRPGGASFWARNWPFFAAGGAAAVLVTVFVLARDQGPGTTHLTIVHGGMP